MDSHKTRVERRPRVAAPILAALLLFGGRSAAVAQTPEGPGETAAVPEDRRTLRRLPANLGRGVVGVFHRDTLFPLVAGSVATGGAWVVDDEVLDRINSSPGEGWGQALETVGGPVWSAAFVASLFATGRIFENARFKAASYDVLAAAVVNFGYTEVIKVSVGRERPNGQDNKSFPSGHTSNAFALATVAERHYGWKIGAPAYLLAGLVGASRVEQDKHHLSDVMAGATLGYIVGRAVVRVNSRPLAERSRPEASWNVAPIVARRARGLQVSVTF